MNTKKYIETALIDLLQTKSIDKVKVSEIIDVVGTCKGTFYKYYCDKYELLTNSFDSKYYQAINAEATDWRGFIQLCAREFGKNTVVATNAFLSYDVNSLRYYHENLLMEYFNKAVGKDKLATLSEEQLFAMRVCASNFTEILINWLSGKIRLDYEHLLPYFVAAIPHSISQLIQ